MADIRDFVFNSEYPIDKVIYLKEGKVTSNGVVNQVSFPHNLGFTPFVDGIYSFGDPSFNESYTFGSGKNITIGTPPNTLQVPIYLNISADKNNIYVIFNFLPSDYVGDIYFKIYGLADESADVDVQPTANQADKFVFNSKYNYCKIIKEGYADPQGEGKDVVINHGLGYYPQVSVWMSSAIGPEGWDKYQTFALILGFPKYNNWVEITDQSVIFHISDSPGSDGTRFYYRIYGDQA